MKKILYFAFAALALVACEPNNGATEKVRIGVSLDDNTQPAKGPQRISAVDGVDEIVVNWEEGDKLYYTVGEENPGDNAPFEIISGWKSPSAFFECAQFNLDNLDKKMNWYYNGCANFDNPFELNQTITIVDNKTVINHDYLLYTAKNQKIGTFQLRPDFLLLGVALTGDVPVNETIHATLGTEAERMNGDKGNWTGFYTSHVVNDNGDDISVSLDPTTPTVFYIVLPVDYDFNSKCIWLSRAQKSNMSTALDLTGLSEYVEMAVNTGTALMLNIHVTKIDNPSTGWQLYLLNQVKL